jgi:hypothetical protein
MNKLGFPSSALQKHLLLIKNYIWELDRQGARHDPVIEEVIASEDEKYRMEEILASGEFNSPGIVWSTVEIKICFSRQISNAEIK